MCQAGWSCLKHLKNWKWFRVVCTTCIIDNNMGIEPGPHWWEASALINAPPLHPWLAITLRDILTQAWCKQHWRNGKLTNQIARLQATSFKHWLSNIQIHRFSGDLMLVRPNRAFTRPRQEHYRLMKQTTLLFEFRWLVHFNNKRTACKHSLFCKRKSTNAP